MGIPANYFATTLGALNVSKKSAGLSCNLDWRKLGIKMDIAQLALDAQVWIDAQKYMPLDTGMLKSNTSALNAATHGEVYMYDPSVPYGHYQYEGVVYVDPVYMVGGFTDGAGEFWSRPGVKKIPTEDKLNYKQPNAQPHWGEVAIQNHKDAWVNVVKRALQ